MTTFKNNMNLFNINYCSLLICIRSISSLSIQIIYQFFGYFSYILNFFSVPLEIRHNENLLYIGTCIKTI